MSKTHNTRLPILCNSTHVINKLTRSPNSKPKTSSNSIKNTHFGTKKLGDHSSSKIMVVVDSSRESKVALQWALMSNVHVQDTLVLVCIIKQFNDDEQSKMNNNLKAYQLLYYLRNMCLMRRPGVQVEVVLLEGNEKGPIIVEEAKRQRVSLLILGQKKRPMLFWRILRTWAGKINRQGDAEYCIQNASCMTIAIRRRSNRLGGYLITTKQHKNFWLLA